MRKAFVGALAVLLLGAPLAWADFREDEQANYSKTREREQHEYGTPAYRAALVQRGAMNAAELAVIRATDPERNPDNACAQGQGACAGDVRLYDWGKRGFGIEREVLWTARSGATIEGRAWATRSGRRKRPAVVITTGSIQAPEPFYLYAAETLAKKGYVVVTYDVQGQGRSDTYGEPPDQDENVPFQQPDNFVDGTLDALDFMLSTPSRPFTPRPSRTSGTSHAPKQRRRVATGKNAPFNPLHHLVDPRRIGIVGHSLGAYAVSAVGSRDRRVDAIVAWDNLSVGGSAGGFSAPYVRPRVPALGMSADYGLTPSPYSSPPNPQARNRAAREFSRQGVDTAQINIRGGTHYEWSYIPSSAFPATLRGMDAAAWYTGAWLDKYVKRDETADVRLLTRRWHSDGRARRIDPRRDGNLLSTYLRSRFDFRLADGSRARCENVRRSGCGLLAENDCEPRDYRYLVEALTPDGRELAPGALCGVGSCRDRWRPFSRFTGKRRRSARKGRLTLRGRARDRACRRRRGRVARVSVAVAKRRHGSSCRYLKRNGRLARWRPCRKSIFLRARGKSRFRFRPKRRLPRGWYVAFSRTVDRPGNVERGLRRRGKRRNVARFRVR